MLSESVGVSVSVSGLDRLLLSGSMWSVGAAAEGIAEHWAVRWIEPRPVYEVQNHWGSGLLQSGVPGVLSLQTHGLTGAGETVGCGDTGLDVSNCYFHDSAHPSPAYNSVNFAHRKLIAYQVR
jgi:hypothetical protein